MTLHTGGPGGRCVEQQFLVVGIAARRGGVAGTMPRLQPVEGLRRVADELVTGRDLRDHSGVEAELEIEAAEHEFNASTFTARVICSSGADVADLIAEKRGATRSEKQGWAKYGEPVPAGK